jgi:hypothetical protein
VVTNNVNKKIIKDIQREYCILKIKTYNQAFKLSVTEESGLQKQGR